MRYPSFVEIEKIHISKEVTKIIIFIKPKFRILGIYDHLVTVKDT